MIPELRKRKGPVQAARLDGEHKDTQNLQYSTLARLGILLRNITALLVLNFLLSKFITDSYLWGYSGKWSNPALHLRPYPNLSLTESQLARYDGSHPDEPIYLAILDEVYDVSANPRMYGPGGAYSHFAGVDGARAFATGCFSSDLTHDVRGLTKSQLDTIYGWQKYYRERSSNYRRVGTVHHDEIPNDAPLHPPCDQKNERRSPLSRGVDSRGT